ncbi:MAG: YczE/YyaS/YitT family protein [Clostridium sp.]
MSTLIKRYFFFILGLIINSFGVAFITKSTLGTSQISSIPYVLSLKFTNLSFGQTTFIFNMLFILIQLDSEKDFHPIQFRGSWPTSRSAFIDISMLVLAWLNPQTLPLRILSLLIGCAILAIGISVEVAPDVIKVPGEGIVHAISRVSGIEFGKVKIRFDVTPIIMATLLSFLFFHKLNGIGLGTIISAVLVGPMISFMNRYLPGIGKIRSLADHR